MCLLMSNFSRQNATKGSRQVWGPLLPCYQGHGCVWHVNRPINKCWLVVVLVWAFFEKVCLFKYRAISQQWSRPLFFLHPFELMIIIGDDNDCAVAKGGPSNIDKGSFSLKFYYKSRIPVKFVICIWFFGEKPSGAIWNPSSNELKYDLEESFLLIMTSIALSSSAEENCYFLFPSWRIISMNPSRNSNTVQT